MGYIEIKEDLNNRLQKKTLEKNKITLSCMLQKTKRIALYLAIIIAFSPILSKIIPKNLSPQETKRRIEQVARNDTAVREYYRKIGGKMSEYDKLIEKLRPYTGQDFETLVSTIKEFVNKQRLENAMNIYNNMNIKILAASKLIDRIIELNKNNTPPSKNEILEVGQIISSIKEEIYTLEMAGFNVEILKKQLKPAEETFKNC